MADQNTSLPVRTESAGDVISKIADKTIPSQQLAVDAAGLIGAKTFDGTGTSIGSNGTGNSLNVYVSSSASTVADRSAFVYGTTPETVAGAVFNDTGATVTTGQQAALRMNASRGLHVNLRDSAGAELVGQKTSAASVPVVLASDQSTLPVKDVADGSVTGGTAGTFSQLAGLVYNTALPTLTTGQQVALQGNVNGKLLVANPTAADLKVSSNTNDGAGNAITSTASALDVNIKSGTAGSADKTTFTYGTTVQQTVGGVFQDTAPTLTAGQEGAVRLTAQRGLHTNLRDSAGNELLGQKTSANSIPVTIASDQTAIPVFITDSIGTEVNNYLTSTAVAVAASVNHDYTVTAAKTFRLSQVEASGSGKMKVEVQVETGVASGTFNSFFVKFNSTADTNISCMLSQFITVAAGVRVRVIRTNLDLLAQNLYSTISGYEV